MIKYKFNLPKGKEFTKKDKKTINELTKWLIIGIMCGFFIILFFLIYYVIIPKFYNVGMFLLKFRGVMQ